MVGDVANVAEVVTLGACGLTGVACAAVPWVSGASFALDIANAGVDFYQSDWGEAGLGALTVIGGVVAAKGAKAWMAPTSIVGNGGVLRAGSNLGNSEELFTAVVGGGFDTTMWIAGGSFSNSDGSSSAFTMFHTTYAL